MVDPADVGLVDAHPKGDRGDDRVDTAAHECILRVMPLFVRQAGMVGERLQPILPQVTRHIFRGLLQRHVDDRGSLPFLQSARQQPEPIPVGAGGDPVGEVWPEEGILYVVCLGDAEGPPDVGRDRGCRRGRQCQHGADAEILGYVRQP